MLRKPDFRPFYAVLFFDAVFYYLKIIVKKTVSNEVSWVHENKRADFEI
jgi:hypothetical protein